MRRPLTMKQGEKLYPLDQGNEWLGCDDQNHLNGLRILSLLCPRRLKLLLARDNDVFTTPSKFETERGFSSLQLNRY